MAIARCVEALVFFVVAGPSLGAASRPLTTESAISGCREAVVGGGWAGVYWFYRRAEEVRPASQRSAQITHAGGQGSIMRSGSALVAGKRGRSGHGPHLSDGTVVDLFTEILGVVFDGTAGGARGGVAKALPVDSHGTLAKAMNPCPPASWDRLRPAVSASSRRLDASGGGPTR